MTGEQLRELIRNGVIEGATFPRINREIDEVTDAVLRAIRAAGIVMGERLTRTSDEGLALVRVVE